MSRVAIAVLVSGGGTNLQALIDTQAKTGLGSGTIALVLSSSPCAYALERAKLAGIATEVLSSKECPNLGAYDAKMLDILREYGIDMVVLAGFLRIVGPKVLASYKNRIINVHPSLIPSFSGPGCYGLKVHEAALKAGVKVTGATVHYVSSVVDGGEIILQKAVEVKDGDTAESLQRRVMQEAEWLLLPQAVALLAGQIQHEREKLHEKESAH